MACSVALMAQSGNHSMKLKNLQTKLKKLMTNRKQCDIINTESEGNIMTKEEILERLIDGYIKYQEEPPCDHFGQICPNYINQTCTCNYDHTNCEIYVKKLLTNRK